MEERGGKEGVGVELASDERGCLDKRFRGSLESRAGYKSYVYFGRKRMDGQRASWR